MNDDQFSDMAVPVDPYAERCKENARRLHILRERLAAGRGDTCHGQDHHGLAAEDEAPG